MDGYSATEDRRRHGPTASPVSTSPLAALADLIARPVEPVVLDEIDVSILTALRSDARKSQRALSKEVPLSPPAIGERIARMERMGVIRGYTLEIGWAEAGLPMMVHMSIATGTGADLVSIVNELRRIPELVAVHIVTGGWDLLVRFRIRDQVNLQNVLLGSVWQIDGIQRVETNIELAHFEGDEIFLRG
ncbi:hypothetical protein GCM10022200_25130 [Microbacterium awajiense]|uniref:HTH asnC-type domain-containing protein n=1 Tax=Microbacterium awajiense TaxID=415214 RepID=A0ABP7AVB3_9MICO